MKQQVVILYGGFSDERKVSLLSGQAVFDNTVFSLAEIIPAKNHIFFDYTAKYTKGECLEVIPALISRKLEQQIKESSLKIHNALGCKGVTRSEFIVKNNIPYFLEINTTPGMTATSLVPQQANIAGIFFSTLITNLINEALEIKV